MATDKPTTVTVEARQLHTYQGQSYDVGDTYDIEEQYADSVVAQGKAVRVADAGAPRRRDRAADAPPPAAPPRPTKTLRAPTPARTAPKPAGKVKPGTKKKR